MKIYKNQPILSLAAICLISIRANPLSHNLINTNNALYEANLVCTYKLSFKMDSTSNFFQTENFSLFIHNNNSLFESKKKMLNDSIYASYDAMPFSQETINQMSDAIIKAPQPEFNYIIYKNSNSVIYLDEIDPDKKYTYTEPNSIFSWQILPTKMIVNGYNCQKATTNFRGRNYVAWFTRTIPVSDGPYKFHGLPGLIVKINDVKNYYTFDLSSLKPTNKALDISMPKETISTTRNKYLQALNDYNANYFEHAKQSGVTFINPESAKQRWKDKLKRHNNPLELL